MHKRNTIYFITSNKKIMLKSVKQLLLFIPIIFMTLFVPGCKSDVDMKKQQKAFYVDANGNLLNKKDQIVKKKGEFKLEGGYYIDNNGETIKRNIDKTKDKINKTVDNTKDKLKDAAAGTKDKIKNAAADSKKAVKVAANRTTESVKANFNELFNTKAVGTIYPLTEIKFNPKSHKITNFKKEDVEGMAAALKDNPASRIQVQVYTADAKSRAQNRKISKDRADLVMNMLVALGVSKEQISAKGMGLPTEDAAKAVANAVEVVVEK